MISALLLSFLLPLWRGREDQEGGRLNSCEFLAEGVVPRLLFKRDFLGVVPALKFPDD
jgi:hypothetical protein